MTVAANSTCSRLRLIAAALLAAFAVIACSSGGSSPPPAPTPPPPTTTSVDAAAQASSVASVSSVANGAFVQFTATANLSNGSTNVITQSANWSSSDPTILAFETAGAPGVATAKKVGGPVTITAAESGGQSGTVSYSVSAAIPLKIAIDPAQIPNGLPVGRHGNFKATYTMTDSSTADATNDVDWASSAGGIVLIGNDAANKGKAFALAAGKSNISTSKGSLPSAPVEVTVFIPTQPPQFVVEPAMPKQLPLGQRQQFRAQLKYSTGQVVDVTDKVTWQSSNVAIAQFPPGSTMGLLFANPTSAGQVTVNALDPVSGMQTTPVTVNVAALTIEKVSITPVATAGNPMAVGTTRQLGVIATYSDSNPRDITRTVDWTTGGLGYLSVSNSSDSKGLVTANLETPAGMPKDSIVITDPVSNQSTSLEIETLGRTLDRIEISPITNQEVPLGQTLQFSATAHFTDKSADPVTDIVTWESSGPQSVSISNAAGSKGLATAIQSGDSVITAAYVVNGTKASSNSVVVRAGAATLQTVEIKPTTVVSLALGRSQKLTADGVFSDGTRRDISALVNWRSGNSSIVSVGNSAGTKGVVTSVAEGGPISITATEPRTGKFASKPVSVTGITFDGISIVPAGPVAGPIGITYKDLRADAVFSDGSGQPITEDVQWRSSNDAIATVSNEPGTKGYVYPRALGQVTITASAAGVTSNQVIFTVDTATLQSIAISPSTPQGIKVDDTVQFSATGTYSDGMTRNISDSVLWESSDPKIALITNNAPNKGKLVGKGPGLAIVTASKEGSTSPPSPPTEVVVTTGPGGIGGGFGSGILSVEVEAGGQVNSDGNLLTCAGPNTCQLELPKGTIINLFAIPNAGQKFEEWDGCDRPSGTVCTQTIDNDQEFVKAEFDPQ